MTCWQTDAECCNSILTSPAERQVIIHLPAEWKHHRSGVSHLIKKMPGPYTASRLIKTKILAPVGSASWNTDFISFIFYLYTKNSTSRTGTQCKLCGIQSYHIQYEHNFCGSWLLWNRSTLVFTYPCTKDLKNSIHS